MKIKTLLIFILAYLLLAQTSNSEGFYGLRDIKLKKQNNVPTINDLPLYYKEELNKLIDTYKKDLISKFLSWKKQYPTDSFNSEEQYSSLIYEHFIADIASEINTRFPINIDKEKFEYKKRIRKVNYNKDISNGGFESMIDRLLDELKTFCDRELQKHYDEKNRSK